MGKEGGFLTYHRKNNQNIPVEERIKNFRELHMPLSEDERRQQAAICMNCGVPFCQSGMMLSGMMTGCPLHNLIPEWNDEIYRGNDVHALERLLKVNPFPEFTGRVCPALCEKACMCAQYGEAVTIRDNELYLIETAFLHHTVVPHPPQKRSGKRVAVIGSGPAGLAAADRLNARGHEVTVYEREDRIGGLLMYGIPFMKLDKDAIFRRQRLMEEEGVHFVTNANIGADIAAEELLQSYDALLLCCGAKCARTIPAAKPGEVGGVYFAVDFLTATTKALLAQKTYDLHTIKQNKDMISAKDKHVVIIGGGDTGNDCIGTAIRHGARSVTAIEMMPMPPKSRTEDNPWPEWDKSLKTDYGHEEAIAVFGHDPRRYASTVQSIQTDKKGSIKKATIVQVAFKDGKLSEVAGTEQEIPCDLMLIAAGFTGCEPYVPQAFGAAVTQRNVVQTVHGTHQAKCKANAKIFTAGDMRTGQSLVVRAIADGLAAAKEVDAFLTGYGSI